MKPRTLAFAGLAFAAAAGCAPVGESVALRAERLERGLAGGAEIVAGCGTASGFFFLVEGEVHVMTIGSVSSARAKGGCGLAGAKVRTRSGAAFPVIAELGDSEASLSILKVFPGRFAVPADIIPLVIDGRTPRERTPAFIVSSRGAGVFTTTEGTATAGRSKEPQRLALDVAMHPRQSGAAVIDAATGLVIGVVLPETREVTAGDPRHRESAVAASPTTLSRFLRSVDWAALRRAGCEEPGSCAAPAADGGRTRRPAFGAVEDFRSRLRGRMIPAAVEPAVFASLVRAASLTPALYVALVAVIVAVSRLPQFSLLCLAGALILHQAGESLLAIGAISSLARWMPIPTALAISWLGIVVAAHLLLRALLAGFLFGFRASAVDSRGIRMKVGMMFRPWIATVLMVPILSGAWVAIAYRTIWEAG